MNAPLQAEAPTRRGGQQRIAMTLVCLIAAAAPAIPGVVLTRGMWLAGAILLLRWRKLDVVDALAVVLAVWATATAIGNLDSPAARLGVANFWSACLIFAAVRSAISNRRDVTTAGLAYLAGCLWAAGEILSQGVSLDAVAQSNYVRLGVEGVNPNFTAYALATGVAVAIALLLLGDLPKWGRLAVPLTIPTMAYATVGTDTRGAQASIAASIAYVVVSRFAPDKSWRAVAFGAPALLILVSLNFYGDGNLLWLQEFFNRSTSNLSGRTDIWPVARAIWSEHPWSGVGPGMFPVMSSFRVGAHNLVLSVGAELGMVGLMLYAAVVVAAIAASGRSPAARRIALLIVAAWLPVWLTGHWEVSPAAWVTLAVWSRLRVEDPAP